MKTLSVTEKKKKLLSFIDENAFNSILRLPTQTYKGKDKEYFETVRKEITEDKKKLHQFKTPEEIKQFFLSDICPEHIKKDSDKHGFLNHISTFPEMQEGFIDLCNELGV